MLRIVFCFWDFCCIRTASIAFSLGVRVSAKSSSWANAAMTAAWARAMGVPAEAVLVESASRNTYENAVKSLTLARTHGFQTFVLVTSAVHMPRAAAIFRKAGYTSQGRTLALWPVDTQANRVPFPFSAVPDPISLTTVQAVMREAAGYLVYQLQGYL